MTEYIDFLARVKTYTFEKWTLRSSKITPYHLASWGFNCIAEDTFECTMCQQTISASHLPFQSEVEEQNTIDIELLIKNFFGSIIAVHKEECLYNQNNYDNQIYFSLTDEFLIQNMEELYKLAYDSYDTFDNMNQTKEGSSDENKLDKYPCIDASFLKIIPQQYHFLLSQDQKFVKIKTLDIRKTLATFAWRLEEDSQSGKSTLNCDFCGRCVPLQNYATNNGRNMIIKQQNEPNEAFNPYEEHKYFCKWSSAQVFTVEQEESSQTNLEQEKQDVNIQKSINGWNICINYLLDQFTYQSKKKKTFEAVNEIHKMQDEIKKIQKDFKQFEQTISEQYSKIVNDCESLNIKSVSTSQFKQKLQQNRQSIDDILKDLNLSNLLEPKKKVKTN
ncbi:hypothetical protein ABPG72_006358 [Tetrahymena utriculariae]